ncbi:hypothetical protein VHEMI03217 [[Torrubiella] hemipterigena]|uniref:HAT C-terminal dimerisation domain-containing protein n=1 Tax=[Torrubiella] hemipterigena TaxID=1531966 RepID=A0A0A1TA94_9HYPO|nr:hypothetical protein VHEMI03217 [[Torrubiella] hemipterigena]
MAIQGSPTLGSVSEGGWSDTGLIFHPLSSSPYIPPTNAEEDSTREANEGEKLASKRTSEVWDHSFYSRHKITTNSKGQNAGGTGNARTHLIKHHNRQIQTQNEKRIKGYQHTIDMAQFRAQSDAANHKRRRLDTRDGHDDGKYQGYELDPAVLEQLYVAWITTYLLDILIKQSTHIFLVQQIPFVDGQFELLRVKKRGFRKKYKKLSRKIHITVDLWTSGNRKSILGIIGHYITREGKLKHSVLAVRELQGAHSGDNQAAVVADVLMNYEIEYKLGFFVGDNAQSNDTLCITLSKWLDLNKSFFWDPTFRRLRCNGHIINLSAQSFLFPNIPDRDNIAALDNQINGQLPKEFNTEQMKVWRKKGPLGKLHNISVYISLSTQRLDAFRMVSGNLRLPRDNSTRWNSWYRMLARALILQDAINTYTLMNRIDLQDDILNDNDWAQLESLIEYLEAYEHGTLACEGRYSTVDTIIPITEFLLEIFEDGRQKHINDPFLGPCCQAGWDKLEKYYNKTSESCAYVGAVVLVPTHKWRFFEKGVVWKNDWVEDAQTAVQKVWEEEYKQLDCPSLVSPPQSQQSEKKKENRFKSWSRQHIKVPEVIDEYKRYYKEPVMEMDPDEVFNPIEWWQESTKQKMYPNLSKMALDLLLIPAMSAEVERLFSSCKITITERRNRIGIDAVEAIECLKSWLRENNVAWVDEDWIDRWVTEVEAETQKQKSSEV